MKHTADDQIKKIWSLLNGELAQIQNVSFLGTKEQLFPSVFDLTGFAAASIGAANLAAAELFDLRLKRQNFSKVDINILEAAAAFRSELLLKPINWTLPSLWDPIAGDYQTIDGWIRLHTNYKHHKKSVFKSLNFYEDVRSEIEKKVSLLHAEDLEKNIIFNGGCAAVMHNRETWLAKKEGLSSSHEKAFFFEKENLAHAKFGEISHSDKPLSGIKVLDLTRVIAGPECTKFLASQGAEVLRIDHPGFEEVPSLLPETTVGKKCFFIDLKTHEGKLKFESLIKEAHVIIVGLRADVLDNHGFSLNHIRKLNPSIIVGLINAYGWKSNSVTRRGFDSLVQMSSGIAALGMEKKRINKPQPMPAQALDHGAGFLLAAAICHALSVLYKNGQILTARCSLIGVANFLFSSAEGNINLNSLKDDDFDSCLYEDTTEWGIVKRVLAPGLIDGRRGTYSISAGSLGRHNF